MVLHWRRHWPERTRRTLGWMQVVMRASGEESRPLQHQRGRLLGCCEPASYACCGQESLPANCESTVLLETTL